jgi:hypothetical protein
MSALNPRVRAALSLVGQAPTRSGVLISITQAFLHETGSAINKFAEQLAESYLAAVPEGLRRAPLRVPDQHGDADEYYKTLAANTKAVQRYLDGTVPIPVDIEEVWCRVMPPPYRDRAIFELCARFGVLPVLVSEETDIHALADLMRDEAAMIEAMAPILADGDIDDDDRPAAIEAIPKVRKAMAAMAGLLARLESVTGQSSLQVVGGHS